MKKREYFLILCVLFGLTLAFAAGQEVGGEETALQEPEAVQLPSEPTVPEPTQVAPAVPQEEPLPQSDEVIDRIAGEVEIRPDQVVKWVKLLFGELEIKGTVLEDVQMIVGEIEVEGRVNDRVEVVAGEIEVSGRVGPGGVDLKFGAVKRHGTISSRTSRCSTTALGSIRTSGMSVPMTMKKVPWCLTECPFLLDHYSLLAVNL